MDTKYYNCKCKLKDCNFGFRVSNCTLSEFKWFLAKSGLHPDENISDLDGDEEVNLIIKQSIQKYHIFS